MRLLIGRHDVEEPVFQPKSVTLILKVMGNNLLLVFAPSKTLTLWEFPGGPVVRTQRFHCPRPGSTPGGGTKIPQLQSTRNKCSFCLYFAKILLCVILI